MLPGPSPEAHRGTEAELLNMSMVGILVGAVVTLGLMTAYLAFRVSSQETQVGELRTRVDELERFQEAWRAQQELARAGTFAARLRQRIPRGTPQDSGPL